MVSAADSYQQGGFESSLSDSPNLGPRPRHDSNALLTLPTPLSVSRPSASSTSTGFSRSSEDAYFSEAGQSSHARLIPSPGPGDRYNNEAYDSPTSATPRYPSPGSQALESHVSRAAAHGGAVLRQQTISNQYPGETANPFHSSEPHVASGYDSHSPVAEPEETLLPRARSPPVSSHSPHGRPPSRGVTLADNGPIVNTEAVRRVPRPGANKRSSTASPATPHSNTNRYSRGSPFASPMGLPPGAAPPQSGGGHSYN